MSNIAMNICAKFLFKHKFISLAYTPGNGLAVADGNAMVEHFEELY